MAVFAALLKPVIDNFDKNNHRSGFKWMFFSSFPIGVFALIWSFGGEGHMWQRNLALGLAGAFIGASGFIFAGYALGQSPDSSSPSGNGGGGGGSGGPGVVGHSIVGNGQGGTAEEIISKGTAGQPSTGADISVHARPGQSATGLSVIQNGPGTGLRIIQEGPGTGMKITVDQ